MQKIIDLTLPYTDHMPCQSAFPGNVFVQLKSHEETLALKQGTQDDPFTSAWHYISTVDHIGTHIDAFYHMSPTGEPRLFVWTYAASLTAGRLPSMTWRRLNEKRA